MNAAVKSLCQTLVLFVVGYAAGYALAALTEPRIVCGCAPYCDCDVCDCTCGPDTPDTTLAAPTAP